MLLDMTRSRLFIWVLAALALLAVACGEDDGGTATEGTQAPDQTASVPLTATTVAVETVQARVYLVRDEKVAAAGRQIPAPASAPSTATGDVVRMAARAVQSLLEGPTSEEEGWGMGSEIPEGTELLGLDIVGGVATINLSGEFESGGGSQSMQARVAQVVFTLTGFSGVERVAFLIDGTGVESIGGEGVMVDPPVGRDAFAGVTPAILVESPLPGAVVSSPLTVSGTSATFEGTVQLEVDEESGTVAYEGFFTSSGANGVHGPFEETVTFDVETPGAGSVVLWEEDVSDQSPSGQMNRVEIPVQLS